MGNFFQINFISLVPELYTLHCFLCNKIIVLEFFYKIIIISYFLGNTYKYDYTEIFEIISWLDFTKLLFDFNNSIIIFMTQYFYL